MSAILKKLSHIAVEAAGVPFADPGLVAQINEATVRIAEAQKKTDGMDLALVRAGADNLRRAPGRGRGTGNLLDGIFEKVIADGTSNLVWNGVGRWLDSVGIGPDEKTREEEQGKQGDNAEELCTSVGQCCDAIAEVSETSDLAAETMLDLVVVIVRFCSGAHPAPGVAATLMPLAKEGLDYVRGTVEERNECIERCLSECEARCRDAEQHQPKPVPEFCGPGAPQERQEPCDPPRPDEPKDPEAPGPKNPDNPQSLQQAPCPTGQANTEQVSAPAGNGAQADPKPGPGAARTVPASAAPPSFTAMAGVPGALTITADVDADINLNANTAFGAHTDLAAAGDLVQGIGSLTQGLQLPSPQTFAASLAQALAAAGCETGQVPAEQLPAETPPEDGCEEETGKQAESTEKSCCGQDCACCAEDAPEPEPEPEPCPEPEPSATEGPTLGEGTFSPPPELAEVPEPPAPAEKLAAGTQPAAVGTQPAPVVDPPTSETTPAPAEPAEPGDDARIKKTSGW